MQNQKSKNESDLLKKTSKLPQEQPTKEKSPNMQRIDSSLRAVKMDGYVEGHARQAPAYSGQTPV